MTCPASPPLRALLVFGTRPEAIKMAPVVQECRRRSGRIEMIVCTTGQHREMLRQVMDYFGIAADVDLDLMQPDQTLADLTARCLQALDRVVAERRPDCVIAQGDTTTVLAAALAAFYRRVPFVHVEAGLRTGDLGAPWPEEMNRRAAGMVTSLHCAPTRQAAENLLREGVSAKQVHVTGNTVIDALLWTAARERRAGAPWRDKYAFLDDRRMVLVTGHRRENFGQGLEQVCLAIAELADRFPAVEFVYPVHLNPNVREPVQRLLSGRANVHLREPAPYPEFVWLMDRSTWILTDSGGVQEEAPSLGKPVLVTRETTERPEAVAAGAVELVGTDAPRIVARASLLLEDPAFHAAHVIGENPYGDGHAARRIVDLVERRAWKTGDGATHVPCLPGLLSERLHLPGAACFLDRDGVIVEDVPYLSDPAELRLIPGAAESIAELNRWGIPVVVVTNQSGVARGCFPEERIAEVHRALNELLAAGGARIDAYYHCPHHPAASDPRYRTECECRKPRPGMLLRAAAELGLDLRHCCMIGDSLRDIEAGLAAGCRAILVRTGHGERDAACVERLAREDVELVPSVAEAVARWLARAA